MQRKQLSQVLKGMHVKEWEQREYDDGHRVVYVRYVENEEIEL